MRIFRLVIGLLSVVLGIGAGLSVFTISSQSGVTGPAPAAAAQPRVASVVLTDVKDGTVGKAAFTPQTPTIYANFSLADVPGGTKLRCVWTAEKTQVAPPNYKIDEATMNVGGMITGGNCWLSKPTNGWPAGEYRLDMYLGDQLARTVKFRIVAQ